MRRLINSKVLDGHFTFKGGTSLSKAYNIIHRFSEDIDLTINRKAPLICDVNSPMGEGISGNERKRRITALKKAAQQYVGTIIMPALISEIAGEAQDNVSLLEQVVRNKSFMFADNSASYGAAIPRSLRLVPTQETGARLKQDYADMAEMFMKAPPSFEKPMTGISELEEVLNRGKT